jgi:NAD(P)-dependent dehydrogenase (short-subunit alcohol dehydrogenase family)
MTVLAGKTVVITGACGAVGQACVEVFLEKGAQVMMTDVIAPPAQWRGRADVAFAQADVTDAQAVRATFEAAVARFGRIDAAVLAAGIEGVAAPLEEIREADVDRVLAVNVKGSLFWMQACAGHMKENGGGSIVALSSISGVVGSASLAAYTLSKHAVIGLVRAAALETGRFGVRINAVCPGPIESEMMRRLDRALGALAAKSAPRGADADLEKSGRDEAGRGDAARSIPIQRYVSADEVARLAAFLCSDEAAACHGGTYMADGGFTAK